MSHPVFDTAAEKPVRIGVIGLVHDHVHWILGREDRGDFEIVGIAEPDRALAERYSKQHGYSMDIVYSTLEEMIEKANPDAVTAFNAIFDHLRVVEHCAPRGIHVMVEKPLAVSWDHARKMASLARKHGIHLLTNYETTWYGSHTKAYQLAVEQHGIGDLRNLVFYTGHRGPAEIGCSEEFLAWLTDPVMNGGGALTDFGCYGANLATWFMQGEPPVSVTCVTQQVKPHIYPNVDDEATIILAYPKAQAVIQASWNWSHNRKETEIYGTTGYVKCKNARDMEILFHEQEGAFTDLSLIHI
jgi:predicted dehydrogenase